MEQSAVDALNALRAAESLGDVFARMSQGYGRRPGQRARLLSVLAGGSLDVETFGLRAQTFLRSEADALFHQGIDTVRDASSCSLAREAAEVSRKGAWSLKTQCRKAECQCVHDEFLDARRSDVDAAAAALHNSTESSHRSMGRSSREVMASSDPLAGKGKKCWGGVGPGGDIVIALECDPNETLLTTDRSFDHICPALGLAHQRIAPTPPP